MPLDPSIILQGKPIELQNPMDVAAKAMNFKQMMLQNQQMEQSANDQKSMRDILTKNTVTGADGKTALNRGGAFSDMLKTNPAKALELQKQLQEQDVESLKKTTEAAKMLSWSATKDNWGSIRQKAIDMGLPNADQLPQIYSPQFVDRWKMATLDGEKQLSHSEKMMELAQKKQSGENMPVDKKHFVDTLATKNANKTSIKNQIDAVMGNWDTLSDDQKIASGRQLLKTLNSTEGADAIGAEEANRLGSKLEFAIGNFTNSNPTQFGRDLEGFATQAKNTAKSIGDAISSNQTEIDKVMGRKPQGQVAKKDPPGGNAAGKIVLVQNKRYRVGDDGDTLIPLEK